MRATSPTPVAGLLRTALRPERRHVASLAALLVVAMLVPLAGPALIGVAVDDALAGRSQGRLLTVAGAYLAVTVVGEALQLWLAWSSAAMAWRAGNRLRERLAAHVLSLDRAWHGGMTPGALISRVDGDVEALTTFFGDVVIRVLGNAVLMTGVVAVTTAIDWRSGLVVAVTTAAAVGVMVRLRSVAVTAHDVERETAARLYGDLEERLAAIEDHRANGAGGWGVHRLLANSAASWRATRRAWVRGDSAFALTAATLALGGVATLGVAVALERRGALTIGAVLALVRYTQLVRTPVEELAEQLPEVQRALAGATRAVRLLGEEPTVLPPAPGVAEPLPPGPLSVELDGVALAYGSDGPALTGVDLRLEPGTTLGVVGPTGGGKSTLARLLVRFWDPTAGVVRLGGVDLRRVTAADLRQRVAAVNQEVHLLGSTLRDDLTVYGARPATDDRLRAVLEEVGLGVWFARLPNGLDTRLGTDAGLSAGEAQLLAFGRALLTDPGLVVLDEASSRLDPTTEAVVAVATRRLLAGRTAVVIAHRLSTLEEVDRIAVVEAGRVVETGPRADLAADPTSRYARLRAMGAQELVS